MKCAKQNGRPKWAASAALSSLEPSSQTSGAVAPTGWAITPRALWVSGSESCSQATRSRTCSGYSAGSLHLGLPSASTRMVRWSLPGARPMPTSMRPGNSVSSMRKFSATLNEL